MWLSFQAYHEQPAAGIRFLSLSLSLSLRSCCWDAGLNCLSATQNTQKSSTEGHANAASFVEVPLAAAKQAASSLLLTSGDELEAAGISGKAALRMSHYSA